MHTLIIIDASVRVAANAAAKEHFDAVGGELTFTAGLVTPPDLEAITHYWCADRMQPANRALLDVMVATEPFARHVQVFDYDADIDPGFPHSKLSELGLAVYSPPIL
jgi:hypothetical protein